MFPGRFAEKIRKSTNGCWHWIANVDKQGYGIYSVDRRPYLAHRFAYEHLHGPIPKRGEPGHLQVDHECHNQSASCPGGYDCLHRRCVNPAHLVAKTAWQNTEASEHTAAHKNRRKTHCANGHEFTPANTYTRNRPGGGRQCKTCQVANRTRRRREMAATR